MDFGPLAHGDPFVTGIAQPDPHLEIYSTGEIAAQALGFMQELVARVRGDCENVDAADEEKVQASQMLVNVASDTTVSLYTLMGAFPLAFEEIVQKAWMFPCLLPAHPDERKAMEAYLLQEIGLGKLHPLKVRSGRKTFSMETHANQVLLLYLQKIRVTATAVVGARCRTKTSSEIYPLHPLEYLQSEVPLQEKNAKQWMDAIWSLLLADTPEPENHPRLKSLGIHRQNHTTSASGEVTTNAAAANVRAGIKDSLFKYLVRMLRKGSAVASDK